MLFYLKLIKCIMRYVSLIKNEILMKIDLVVCLYIYSAVKRKDIRWKIIIDCGKVDVMGGDEIKKIKEREIFDSICITLVYVFNWLMRRKREKDNG